MVEVEQCRYIKAGYIYNSHPAWKYIPRSRTAKSNLMFVTEGIAYMEEGEHRYNVEAGECLCMENGLARKGYRPSGVPTGFYYVQFETDGKLPLPKHFKVHDPEALKDLYTTLIRRETYTEYPQEAKNDLLHALFYEALYLSIPHSPKNTSIVETVKEFIYLNRKKGLNANDIARKYGFCRDHLSRLFYQSEHMTLKQYLDKIKVELIEDYLSIPNYSIKQVAEITGFANQTAMCKFYKYHTGIPPSEFQKKYYGEKT